MSVPRGTNVDMPATSVAHIIQQCVELGRRTPYSETDIRFAVVPFLRWTVLEAGMDPELDELFSTRTIEQYVQSAARDYSAGVLGNIRTRLFRLAEQIGDPDGRRVPISALPPANPAKPYGRREIASMMSWANTHATPSRRASAINLLALGLGAGLSTSEIESALVSHPRIAEAAVVGAADETTGQAVVAYVILRSGDGNTGEALIQELRNHVAREIGAIAKPRQITIVPELPKTRSGKIMRRLLRDVAEGRDVGDTTTLSDPSVMALIANRDTEAVGG